MYIKYESLFSLGRVKKMSKYLHALSFFVITAAIFTAAAEPITTRGEISDVIVYRGQALVTRTIKLDQPAGDLELLVEDLPDKVLPDSLYAQVKGGATVLSVRYRVKETHEDTSEEVKAIDAQLAELDIELYETVRNEQRVEVSYNHFADMWKLSLDGAYISLDRGAFSSESMKDFLGYLEERGDRLHEINVKNELLIKDLEKRINELREKRARLTRGHKKQDRQALVYINKMTSESIDLDLSYLVNDANWTAQYNLRAIPNTDKVRIEYNAVVHQSSGETWPQTALALSTAVPALVATPPTLEPMEITLASGRDNVGRLGSKQETPQAVDALGGAAYDMEFYQNQTQQFNDMLQIRNDNIAKGIKAQRELNRIAFNNQLIELEADRRMLQEIKQSTIAIKQTEGVSVMYRLPGKLTLPSRSDQQLLNISTFESPAAFTFIAAPLLTDFVYLQADITNDSETILLPGPAAMYRNGEFVGKGDIKLVTIGQTFTAGFGVDSQIQVVREFKDKKIETLWGNRVDQQAYRIEISNYKDKQVPLRLLDRLPYTENKALSIELTAKSHDLSNDADYIRTQKDKGILRWDLTLEPNTHGEKAAVVTYEFTMKYDNDMRVQSVTK